MIGKDHRKILVLMSGGVDSSTAAALLVRAGHEVSGVYLKLWELASNRHPEPRRDGRGEGSRDYKDGIPPLPLDKLGVGRNDNMVGIGDPCWAQEMRDAARVAAHLGIQFSVWDVTAQYKKRVLENFLSEYAAGRTPNPDVLCNSEIKFGVALTRARKTGYEYIATGHYARIAGRPSTSSGTNNLFPERNGVESKGLYVAVDKNKDQSYFLWRLTPEQLARVMFPIGQYTKPQVRKLARKFGLHNWNKKDSQGVCFLGKIKLKEFLYRRNVAAGFSPPHGDLKVAATLVRKPGPIIDVHGNLLGFHDGLAHFTIGQRQGVNVGDGHGPYFVVEKDMTTNTLVVAHENDEAEYRAVECTISNVQFHDSCFMIHDSFTCLARTRYRAPLVSVILRRQPKDPVTKNTGFFAPLRSAHNDGELHVQFKEPQRAVAPGQSIVFYDGDRVIGGGVIDRVVVRHPEPRRDGRGEGSRFFTHGILSSLRSSE